MIRVKRIYDDGTSTDRKYLNIGIAKSEKKGSSKGLKALQILDFVSGAVLAIIRVLRKDLDVISTDQQTVK